jgi:hypothetical protein
LKYPKTWKVIAEKDGRIIFYTGLISKSRKPHVRSLGFSTCVSNGKKRLEWACGGLALGGV